MTQKTMFLNRISQKYAKPRVSFMFHGKIVKNQGGFFSVNPLLFFSIILLCSVFAHGQKPLPGANQTELYLPLLKDKRIAIVANQTSTLGSLHLVDSLRNLGCNVVRIFAPEHGFRGDGDAGEHLKNSVDRKTGIPVVSLYGNYKKPSSDQLADLDLVLFDIQDVGVRFYTYLSTLHYVMEACSENDKPLLLLDRPNPNGHRIDGPVLEPEYASFVGLHPVPILYGMTIGEYAAMINGEQWLEGGRQCRLIVIPNKFYTHRTPYSLPIPPSPNLTSDRAIALYPSLCLFEGTSVSVGRGTLHPFECYGHPCFPKTDFSYLPKPQRGSKEPMYLNVECHGFNLKEKPISEAFDLTFLITARRLLADTLVFIDHPKFFNNLAGNASLAEQLLNDWDDQAIRATWQPGLETFKAIRAKYLIYP